MIYVDSDLFGIFRRRAYDVPPLFRLKGNFEEKKKKERRKKMNKKGEEEMQPSDTMYGCMSENNIEAMLFAKIFVFF